MSPVKRQHRVVLLLALVVAAVMTVAVTTAGGATASPRAAASAWTDPAGDAVGGAPDLTAVQITNDAAGTITTTVTVPMVADTGLMMFMDNNMDQNLEYGVVAMGVAPGVVTPMVLSAASKSAVSVPSLRMSATATTITFSFAKADLGVNDAFVFWLETMTSAQLDNDQVGDQMPEGNAAYMYVLTTPPAPTPAPAPTPTPTVVKPIIAAPVTMPKVAVAGKRFTASFSVTRSDTGGPLMTGKMVCDPRVAGKLVPHAESFKAGKAKLSFVLPKTAHGKLLKVKLTIRAGTQSATRVATFHVR